MNNGHGFFNNPLLQAEYNRLISEGIEGLTAALDVGVQIEEMDIEDLESMMEKTDRTDIKRVMTDLLDGSNSHLTAFETQIGYIIQ